MKLVFTLSRTALAVALLSTAGMASAVNLVSNPSFELGLFDELDQNVIAGVTQVGGPQPSTKITDWTVSNSLIWIDNSYGGPLFTPYGARFLDLTAYTNNTAMYASIGQSVPTVATEAYTLSFKLGSSNAFGILPVIALSTAGVVVNFAVTAVPTTSSQWTQFSYSFVASSASTAITFTGIQGSDYIGLDDISVTAVPEPGSITMLLAGLVAVGAVVKRRRPTHA